MPLKTPEKKLETKKYKPGWLMKKIPPIRWLGIKYLEKTKPIKPIVKSFQEKDETSEVKAEIYARLSTNEMLKDSKHGKAFGDLNIYDNIKKAGFPGLLKDKLYSIFSKKLDPDDAEKAAASHFKSLGLSAEVAIKAGFKLKTLFDAGYSFNEIERHVQSLADLKNEGFTVDEFLENKKSLSEIRRAGFTITDLLNSKHVQEISLRELKKAGYTASDFHKANVSAFEIKSHFNSLELLKGGYELPDVYRAAVTASNPKETTNIIAFPPENRRKIASQLVFIVQKTRKCDTKTAAIEVYNAITSIDRTTSEFLKKTYKLQ